jgi:hypothetical protein
MALDREVCPAHFRLGSFAWLQPFSTSGKKELRRLLADVHEALPNESAISDFDWHEQSEMAKPESTS